MVECPIRQKGHKLCRGGKFLARGIKINGKRLSKNHNIFDYFRLVLFQKFVQNYGEMF